MRRERMSRFYSQFVLSRPQGSARIAKPLEHECFKMRRTKQTLCVQAEVEGKHRCSSKPVARAKEKVKEVKKSVAFVARKKAQAKKA